MWMKTVALYVSESSLRANLASVARLGEAIGSIGILDEPAERSLAELVARARRVAEGKDELRVSLDLVAADSNLVRAREAVARAVDDRHADTRDAVASYIRDTRALLDAARVVGPNTERRISAARDEGLEKYREAAEAAHDLRRAAAAETLTKARAEAARAEALYRSSEHTFDRLVADIRYQCAQFIPAAISLMQAVGVDCTPLVDELESVHRSSRNASARTPGEPGLQGMRGTATVPGSAARELKTLTEALATLLPVLLASEPRDVDRPCQNGGES